MTSRRAVAVLCRHGHRAPVANLPREAAEAQLWEKLMPSQETTDLMTRSYPLMIEPTNPPPRDAQTRPFGFISTVGLTAMSQVGEKIASEFPFIKRVDKIKAFATNYRRTQISVQALLAGIQVKNQTIVEVRPQTKCAMSCYDAHGDVLIPTMKRVQQNPEFKRADEDRKAAQEAMAKAFPAVLTEHGFEWIHALDYFVCRKSHSLDVLAQLAEFEETVTQHTAWRFQQYYQDPLHMAQVAGPLLQDIVSQLERSFVDDNADSASSTDASELDDDPQPDVTILGGHDVNIMALGYALGIGAALEKRSETIWWPGYGATVSFDAYRIAATDTDELTNDDRASGAVERSTEPEIRVRIALDFVDMSPACAKGVALMLSKFEKFDHPNLSTLADEMEQDNSEQAVDVSLSALKKLADVLNHYVDTHEFVRQLLSDADIHAEVP